jgi:RHS repeat-associated protein
VNGVLVGSGSIFVSSGSTLQSTGTINVANAIAGLTGSVTVTLKLFGGSNGNNATFRLDDFTLNGYTQEVQVYTEGYRYAFNGMEGDNEIKGQGNSYTTEFRQYDARVGRWLSLDPMEKKYPSFSPYSAFNNNPIYFIDPKGLEGEDPKSSKTEKGAGNKDLKLPQDAVIKGRFVDKDDNGVINHGKKILDAKPGDVDRFSVGDKDYVANFDSKGKFNGYVDKAGEMYSFKQENTNSNEAKIDSKSGFEFEKEVGSVSAGGIKLESSISTSIKESKNGITYTSDRYGNTSTSCSTPLGTLTIDKDSFTYGNSNVALGFTKDEELKISFSIPT